MLIVWAVNAHADRQKQDGKGAERARLWRLRNLERSRKTVKDYQARNPEKVFNTHLRKYGLTENDYENMLSRQGYLCAICLREEPNMHQYQRLAVDHDHKTGKVRGLLCSQCNTAIGKLQHSPRILKRAIMYLIQAGGSDGTI